jgi:hypothetical protein
MRVFTLTLNINYIAVVDPVSGDPTLRISFGFLWFWYRSGLLRSLGWS